MKLTEKQQERVKSLVEAKAKLQAEMKSVEQSLFNYLIGLADSQEIDWEYKEINITDDFKVVEFNGIKKENLGEVKNKIESAVTNG